MKPNGYFIPADWEPIIDGLANELYKETGEYPDGSDLTATLVERLKMPMAGSVLSGSLSDSGYSGVYWSSTVYSSYNAYYLYFYSGYVDPTNGNDRYNGRSVRCVAR